MLFEKNDTVLFIGDSIMDYERKKPVGEGLFNAWGTSFVADAASLLCGVYPELNLRIINMGISGNQSRDLLARWDTDVTEKNPDWVCMMIGINDVWRQFDQPQMPETHVLPEDYAQCCEEIIRKTLAHSKGMVLMTPYIMEPNKKDPMRARMNVYGEITRQLSEKYHLPFVDMQSAWDELFKHMHPCNIAWDRIHPNQTGCMYIARQLLLAVGFDFNHIPEKV